MVFTLLLTLLSIPVQLLAGWFVADLLSALFHLAVDSLGGSRVESWPVVGKMVFDFRKHHDEPENPEYLGCNFGPSTLALSLTGVLLACLLWAWPVFAITVGVGIAFSQATHRWAHADTVPAPVKWLQDRGLFLSPLNHVGHHLFTDRYFGSLNGWSHPLVHSLLLLFGL